MSAWSNYDRLFRGHVFQGFALVWFAVGVNFGNFTDALASVGVKIPNMRAMRSTT
jgi:hypothetical protein